MRNDQLRLWTFLTGAMLSAAAASAAPILTITAEGSPTDTYGDAAPGYTAYLITAVADPGEVIGSIVAGGTTGTFSTFGFYGPFLQEWDISGRTVAPTPYESVANSTGAAAEYSTDTHFLVAPANTITVAPEAEDNLYSTTTSPAGAPPQNAFDYWGTGSYLTGTFAPSNANLVNSLPLAYLVLPTGRSATYSVGLVEENPNGSNVSAQLDLSGSVPATTATPEPVSMGLIALAGTALLARRRSR